MSALTVEFTFACDDEAALMFIAPPVAVSRTLVARSAPCDETSTPAAPAVALMPVPTRTLPSRLACVVPCAVACGLILVDTWISAPPAVFARASAMFDERASTVTLPIGAASVELLAVVAVTEVCASAVTFAALAENTTEPDVDSTDAVVALVLKWPAVVDVGLT